MSVLRCLIVDDEPPSRAWLRKLLMQIPGVEVIAESGSVAESVLLVRELRPELLLLDIQLGAEDGFLIPASLDVLPHVIFVTGFDQHAVRAFELNAVDYLLKPVTLVRLAAAIDRVRQRVPVSQVSTGRLKEDDLALIPIGSSGFFVQVRDILLVEAEGSLTRVTLDSDRVMTVRWQLREWLSILPTTMFRALDRSHVINITRITEAAVTSRGSTLLLGSIRIKLELGTAASRRLRELLEGNS
jgi:two-component system LytT family response regulator